MDTNNSANTKPTTFTTKTQQAFFEVSEVFTQMNLLIAERRRKDVNIDIVEEAFKKSFNQNFYGFAVDFAMFLQDYFAVKGDRDRVERYAKLAMECSQIKEAENVVKIKYKLISFRLSQTRDPGSELVKDLFDICEELKPYLKYDSATIWTYVYSLLNLLASIKEEHDKILIQSWKVIEYFQKEGIHRELPFYRDITFASIALGQYDNAQIAIEKASSMIKKRTEDWSVFVYYQVIIQLHQAKYQDAYEIYVDARDKKYLSKEILRKEIVEQWDVVKGYLKFLVQIGKVNGSSQFKIARFVNSIEVFKKDMSGQVVNVLILKIILRLNSDRGVDNIIKEEEAIKKYSERHLLTGSRPRVFFQMLHKISKHHFQKSIVQSKAAKYLALMPQQKGYNPDLEIIPFEHLWEMILDTLD